MILSNISLFVFFVLDRFFIQINLFLLVFILVLLVYNIYVNNLVFELLLFFRNWFFDRLIFVIRGSFIVKVVYFDINIICYGQQL